MREEVDSQINTLAEEEVSKLIQLVIVMLEKQGVSLEEDKELKVLLDRSNDRIEREFEKELG